VERALQRGNITLKESALFLRHYENGLSGTTYLEEETTEDSLAELGQNGGTSGNGATSTPTGLLGSPPAAHERT
jgi:hypothetical protein